MNTVAETYTSQNWKPTSPGSETYSSNEVIDAYLKGKEEGIKQKGKLILNKLKENAERTTGATGKVFNFLHKKKFNPIAAYLRLNSWDSLDILITIPEKEFISEKLLTVYSFVSRLENELETDFYNITFSFADEEDDFDREHLVSDGFVLRYSS